MNNLHKTLTLGEEQIELECNREIIAETMTKFNDYFADFLDMIEERRAKGEEDKTSFVAMISNALRKGNTSVYLKSELYNEQITNFALPLLLKCANKELTTAQSQTEAKRIVEICENANGLNVLCDKVFELILMGFIAGETEEQKPTITIEIA